MSTDAPVISPYCDHPECHNPHTSDYYSGPYGTSSGLAPIPTAHVAFFMFDRLTQRLGRRWCRSHALINEGWAVG